MPKPRKSSTPEERAAVMMRIVVSVMTCLGALGLLALIYFPLRHLQ